MPILRGLLERRSLEDPQLPLTSMALVDWLNGPKSHAGVNVTPENSIRVTAVYRAVALIAGAVAGLPLLVYRDGTRERQTVPLLGDPNPDQTNFEFWEYVLTSMLLWGNAYLWRARAGGVDKQLWPIHPARVTPQWSSKRNPQLADSRKQFEVRWPDDTRKTYGPEDILHLPALSYDGLAGLSPIGAAQQAIGLSMAAEEYGARFFGSGSLHSGVLQTEQKLDETQATRLKERWKQKMAGLAKAHDIAVLDAGAKFEKISIPPEEAQFLETRRFQVAEIARLYGVPPHMLMDVEKSTSWGTGIEQQGIGFVQYTLDPWLKRVERRVTQALLPKGRYAEFLVEGLLRGDTKTRYEAYAIAINTGWMTPDEVRGRENLAPRGADTLRTPAGTQPAGGDNGET